MIADRLVSFPSCGLVTFLNACTAAFTRKVWTACFFSSSGLPADLCKGPPRHTHTHSRCLPLPSPEIRPTPFQSRTAGTKAVGDAGDWKTTTETPRIGGRGRRRERARTRPPSVLFFQHNYGLSLVLTFSIATEIEKHERRRRRQTAAITSNRVSSG